jgi:hypothetical protein
MAWVAVSWGCVASPPCPVPENVPQVSVASQSDSALQQKVKAQERRINELSAQLKLLKHIDQDQQKQR